MMARGATGCDCRRRHGVAVGDRKAEAVHGDVSVPRTAVVSAQVVPDGMDEVHGFRMPGTGLPGVIMAGTRRDKERVTFAVCHAAGPLWFSS